MQAKPAWPGLAFSGSLSIARHHPPFYSKKAHLQAFLSYAPGIGALLESAKPGTHASPVYFDGTGNGAAAAYQLACECAPIHTFLPHTTPSWAQRSA